MMMKIRHSTSSTGEAEDTFLRGIIKDLCRGDQEDIKVDETAEGVSHYVTQENTLCRAKSSKGVLKHHFVSVRKKLQRGLS